MSIKASEISDLIKARISQFDAASDLIKARIDKFQSATEARNVGTVVSVTDGIVRMHGLARCPLRRNAASSSATPSASR